jgi:hypothetical protein
MNDIHICWLNIIVAPYMDRAVPAARGFPRQAGPGILHFRTGTPSTSTISLQRAKNRMQFLGVLKSDIR